MEKQKDTPGCHETESQRELDRLISDLQSFLLVLDQENLSYIAQAKKKSIADLLSRLQNPPSEDAEYMVMSCISSVMSKDIQNDLPSRESGHRSVHENEENKVLSLRLPASLDQPLRGSAVSALPLHVTELLAEDSYEEAEPFNPLSHSSKDCMDSDSSHYESYGEEEDCVKDRAHYIQWSSTDTTTRSTTESRICGFLWRKKWLGQWSKQLFVVREHVLLCYKCAKDLHPLLELNLLGCHVTYKSKRSKKVQHEVKVMTGSETVVMGCQSWEQAEEWRKVIEAVSHSSCSGTITNSSPCLKGSESKRNLSKTKSVTYSSESDDQDSSSRLMVSENREVRDKGFLNVLMNCQWQSLWCQVENGILKMHKDNSCTESPQYCVNLEGSEVKPKTDTTQGYRITVSQQGKDIAVLETSSEEDREHWLSLLQAGSEVNPESMFAYEDTNLIPSTYQEPTTSSSVSDLMLRRFPIPNTYIDDPFGQLSAVLQQDSMYSSTDLLEQLLKEQNLDSESEAVSKRIATDHPVNTQGNSIYCNMQTDTASMEIFKTKFPKSQSEYKVKTGAGLKDRDFFRSQQILSWPEKKEVKDTLGFSFDKTALPKLEEKVHQLERTCRAKSRVKAGSEINLLAIGKSLKRASCGQSLALAINRSNNTVRSEGSFLTPLLKRTASAKSALKRVPSVIVIEKGKVLQKRKEWEMKTSV
nr:PREDICTED: actin filament-associated protein 1-like 2 isoform X2 [Latimeria chalumnae]|eukprot:XP_005992668.1 PREDICTED: actin filament-associated protein 1-like 2 isoform X2 [Latimeria chalumnae]